MKKFVIIAQPRTGTSMLVNTLNTLPNFNVYGELFVRAKNMLMNPVDHPQEVQREMVLRYIRNSYDLSGKSVRDFLISIYNQPGYVGFKLLFPHLKRKFGSNIIKYIQDNNIYKILLYRKNKIKQVISAQTNKKTEKVKVDVRQVVDKIKFLIQEQKQYDAVFANGNFIKVSYEDLTGNKNIKELDLSLLGFDGIVDVPLRKYRDNKLSRNVLNFDELKKAVSEFKEWID